jgi:hypothetical protein
MCGPKSGGRLMYDMKLLKGEVSLSKVEATSGSLKMLWDSGEF